jgi:hypothetical protein
MLALVEVHSVSEEPFLEDLGRCLSEQVGLICLEQLGVFLTVLVVLVLPKPVVFSLGVAGLGIGGPVVIQIVQKIAILDVVDIKIIVSLSALGIGPKSMDSE